MSNFSYDYLGENTNSRRLKKINMKQYITIHLSFKVMILSIFSIFVIGCSIHQTTEKRISLPYDIIIDSVFSGSVGDLIYTGKYIVWKDLKNAPFLHIVDPEKKMEIASVGTFGQGPDEFVSPMLKPYNEDTVLICELNSMKQRLIALNRINTNDFLVEMPDLTSNIITDNKVYVDNKSVIYYSFNIPEKPFLYVCGSDTVPFGHHPLNQNYCVYPNNKSNLLYNNSKDVLLCYFGSIPYISIYHKSGTGFRLIKEIFSEIDYTVDDAIVKYHSDIHGPTNMALLKDFIVSSEYDYESGDEFVSTQNPNQFVRPHSVFVRDYDGHLITVVDIGVPIRSIAGNESGNMLYLVVINPEFQLIKLDLNTI